MTNKALYMYVLETLRNKNIPSSKDIGLDRFEFAQKIKDMQEFFGFINGAGFAHNGSQPSIVHWNGVVITPIGEEYYEENKTK